MAKQRDLLGEIRLYYDQSRGDRQRELFDYYSGEDVPIDARPPVSSAKAKTHTNNHVDFFKDIIDIKIGYMGQRIYPTFNIEDATLKEKVEREFKLFNRYNSLDTMNSQSLRWASISGISHRLCYTEDGVFKIKNIPGWSVVYEYDQSPLDPIRAYYFYETVGLTGVTERFCDVYDNTEVVYYQAGDDYTTAQNFDRKQQIGTQYGAYREIGRQSHNFLEVPIIPILNNDMWDSDCEKSLELMDTYDEVLSDTAAEVKAMRLAYLKMWGNLYTGTDLDGNPIDINTWLTSTSTMKFGTTEEGEKYGDAEFLEKNINDQVIENILNRYRHHIFETSGSVDLREIASTERVEAVKAQLTRLENTAAISERFMRAALYKMMRLWLYWMGRLGLFTVEEIDVDWTFKRVFPRNIESEARTLTSLSNVITLEDALRQVGWDNAEEIAQRAEENSIIAKTDAKPLLEEDDDMGEEEV